jgi:hypothetical protein
MNNEAQLKGTKYDVEILSCGDPLDEWDQFVDESPQGCIFCRSWWLEAICPNGFEILTLRRDGRIVAGIPLPTRRKWGYTAIEMPALAQTLGVLLEPATSEKHSTSLSNDINLMEGLIQALPAFDYFSMSFHYSVTNWLPFYWAGYKQTTRYTYVIHDLSNLPELYESLSQKTRNTLRKAEKSGISVVESDDIDLFLELNKKTFARQGMKLPYSGELVRRLDEACASRCARKIFLAKDPEERIHSALFAVYDGKSMYNLMQGSDPELRGSGGNSLAMWHSIEFAQGVAEKYDFEGSMLRNVERVFRSFGATQAPYFRITKDRRPLPLRMLVAALRAARNEEL